MPRIKLETFKGNRRESGKPKYGFGDLRKMFQYQYSTLVNGFLLDKNHLFGDSRHLASLTHKLTNITWLLLVSLLGLRWRSYEANAYEKLERLGVHSKLMEADQE